MNLTLGLKKRQRPIAVISVPGDLFRKDSLKKEDKGMEDVPEYYEEFEEIPEELEEVPEDYCEEEILKEILLDDEKIPDVEWRLKIAQIENPVLREKEIEAVGKIFEEQKSLKEDMESGKITEDKYLAELEFNINPKKTKATTRCGLASV